MSHPLRLPPAESGFQQTAFAPSAEGPFSLAEGCHTRPLLVEFTRLLSVARTLFIIVHLCIYTVPIKIEIQIRYRSVTNNYFNFDS
jgi:hypothetical protein